MGTGTVPCDQQDSADPKEAERLKSLQVESSPPLMLNIALALQHVMVQAAMCIMVVGVLVQEPERITMAASVFFYTGASTLLQTSMGSRLPLIQAPSLDFLVLLCGQTGTQTACRAQCYKSDEFEASTHHLRELQGMAVVAGLVQFSAGLCGVGGALLHRCGPLVLTPVICMLGFSIYREAALLCSDHWGFAMLTVVLLVFLSQHLRCWSLSRQLKLKLVQVISMLSVLVSVLLVCAICVPLHNYSHIKLHSVPELLLKKDIFNTSQDWSNLNSSTYSSPRVQWFSVPLPGLGLPLLSGCSIAVGISAGLSSCISSQAVYVLTATLLKAPTPPAQACNRGLSVEGLSSMITGLMGAPVGLCSSVPNACTIGLSQCGSRAMVQLAGVMLLVLGLFPPLTQLLMSIPLAIYGGVLSVTYTVAVATGITYLQYTDVDSGRNIFNTGFTVFMSLVLPRWFRMQPGFVYTGVPSLDVFFQSCLVLPVLLVGLLSFSLDHTVSGTLSERGLERNQRTKRIFSLADKPQDIVQNPLAVYDPPKLITKVLNLPVLKYLPFCSCRKQDVEEITVSSTEMAVLLSQ